MVLLNTAPRCAIVKSKYYKLNCLQAWKPLCHFTLPRTCEKKLASPRCHQHWSLSALCFSCSDRFAATSHDSSRNFLLVPRHADTFRVIFCSPTPDCPHHLPFPHFPTLMG